MRKKVTPGQFNSYDIFLPFGLIFQNSGRKAKIDEGRWDKGKRKLSISWDEPQPFTTGFCVVFFGEGEGLESWAYKAWDLFIFHHNIKSKAEMSALK